MLKKNDLDQFRSILLDLQSRVRGDVQHLSDDALNGSGESKSPTHMAELGTDAFEQDFSLRMMENDQELLNEIRAALKRIDEETFGLCEGCLQDGKTPAKASIPKTRLSVLPYTRMCIECQRKREEQMAF